MSSGERHVESHCSKGVLDIQLRRPERKNALDKAMYADLAGAITQASVNDEVRVILFRGSEGCFTSGNDLADFVESPVSMDRDNPVVGFMTALAQCPRPVVAAVEGPAVGIGTTLLLHCDLCYAHPDTDFRLPFASLGLCPEYGSSWLLPRIAGYAKAAQWLLLGESFSAEDALQAGIVNAVVDDPVAVAREQAEKLARQPPEAVRKTKALMKHGMAGPIDQAMKREFIQFSQALKGEEFAAAVSAFFDRKK